MWLVSKGNIGTLISLSGTKWDYGSLIFDSRQRPLCGVNGPIADTDLEQPNVRFGEEQTFSQPAQKRFGFFLTEFLTILGLTGERHSNTWQPGSVYAQ